VEKNERELEVKKGNSYALFLDAKRVRSVSLEVISSPEMV